LQKLFARSDRFLNGARETNTRTGKAIEPGVAVDSAEAAEEAGLQYVNDERLVTPESERQRLRVFWTRKEKQSATSSGWSGSKRLAFHQRGLRFDLSSANGHIQATGRDARSRKQYRYHERWREVRDENKFDRLAQFAKALPNIRRRIARDLKLRALPQQKVLATIVRFWSERSYASETRIRAREQVIRFDHP